MDKQSVQLMGPQLCSLLPLAQWPVLVYNYLHKSQTNNNVPRTHVYGENQKKKSTLVIYIYIYIQVYLQLVRATRAHTHIYVYYNYKKSVTLNIGRTGHPCQVDKWDPNPNLKSLKYWQKSDLNIYIYIYIRKARIRNLSILILIYIEF